MMLSMLRHLCVFCLVIFATALLIGCGGQDDRRRTGTTDARILGDWVAREITYNGQTQPCPGEIVNGDERVSCSGDTTVFESGGQYTVGSVRDDYYFDSNTVTLFNRSGNAASFGVVFDGTANTMTWSWNQNGRPATLVLDRVVVE